MEVTPQQDDVIVDIGGENDSRQGQQNIESKISTTIEEPKTTTTELSKKPTSKRSAEEGEIIHIVSAEDSNEIVDIGAEAETQQKTSTLQSPHKTPPPPQDDKIDMRLFISNLPKSWNDKRFNKMLRDLGVTFARTRKIHGNNFAHIFFNDVAHKTAAFELLTKLQGKEEWNVSEAKSHIPPMKQSDQTKLEFKPLLKPGDLRSAASSSSSSTVPAQTESCDPNTTRVTTTNSTNTNTNNNSTKKRRMEVVAGEEGDPEVYAPDPNRTARDVVSPWWNIPYEEQLERKLKAAREVLVNVTRQCIKDTGAAQQPAWLAALRAQQPACPLENDRVIPSPIIHGYRNKVQFTIGHDVHLKPCVGHLMGAVKDGFSAVADAKDVPTTAPEAEAVRQIVQRYIAEKAKLPPYQKVAHKGFWRIVTIRTTQAKDIQVMMQVNGAAATPEEVAAERAGLTEFLRSECEAQKLKLVSLWWQDWQGVSNSAPHDLPCTLLWGAESISETLLGLTFRISPTAFFQVNTLATAELYKLVQRWCAGTAQTTLMDIYCGSGTIGLTMASVVREVVGIEIVEEAVRDARLNAQANNIKNAAFFAGKAEELVREKLRDWSGRSPNFVGIVDPPRNGLHLEAIRNIRGCAKLRRLVYVSCNQQSLINNAGQLCRPVTNTMKGTPFRPVLAAAVDLFPHTEHTEMVMLFERE